MKIIIVGCGRMGSGLANKLCVLGHEVTIIDTNPEAFKTLGPGFKGKTIVGVGFDRDVLANSMIAQVDGLIVCTNSDDTNALVARIAQNVFKVPKVIARLYDAHKAEIYQSLGIQTISTTAWGIDKAIGILNYSQLDTLLSIGDGKVDIIRTEAPSLLEGKTVNELLVISEIHVVAIRRGMQALIPTMGTIILSRDILYIAVLNTAKDRLEALLGLQ
ncbi:MAG: TrkA family potassium uptake protein [Erysipelotrichaceae bacterium]